LKSPAPPPPPGGGRARPATPPPPAVATGRDTWNREGGGGPPPRARPPRPRHLARGSRPDLLPPGAHGARRQVVHDPQIPLDARGRRGELGAGLGDQGRSAPHARRRLPPPLVDRRAA